VLARGFCRTPHSFFLRLPRELTYTELVCVGLILDATVGWQRDRAWIPIRQFQEVANKSRRAVEEALDRLRERDLVKWTGGAGEREYSLAPDLLPSQEPGERAYGKCHSCGAIGDVEVEPGGVALVPHAFFRKLPKACTHAEWVIVGMVIDATLGWQREWAEISNEEFCAATGLSLRAVQQATGAAEGKGLIEVEERSGRCSRYRVVPESFSGLEARAARTVERRDKSEQAAKQEPKESAQEAEPQEAAPAVECHGRKVFARCLACRQVGLVTLREQPPSTTGPPRARPPGSGAATNPSFPPRDARRRTQTVPASADAASARVVPGLEAYLWRWSEVLREPVTAAFVARISAELGDADLGDFAERCDRRAEYIQRSGQGLAVLLPMARDAAQLAARRAAAGEREPEPDEEAAPACAECGGGGLIGARPREWMLGEVRAVVESGRARWCSCESAAFWRELMGLEGR
jgi:DNA-binding transcriptional ArsR family regulator